jgi:phosphoglycerate dehydrogenase-like enzyme
MPTILYPEESYQGQDEEHRNYGPGATLVFHPAASLAAIPDEVLREVEGLMIFRFWVTAADMARMPKLRAIVRMGVGYDRLDRVEAERRGVLICNVPDYGTTEVADHAMALALSLRRGVLLHHDRQRATPPDGWWSIGSPLLRRASSQGFGIVGLGRIGTAVALRAKAFGFKVCFYDPYKPNGSELALGIERAATLEELLKRSDVLSMHLPHSPESAGMMGAAQFAAMPANSVFVDTARGTNMDVDALYDALKSGHLAGAGLDVLPVEPPVEPVPKLLAAYRAREPWLEGRLVITPHSAYWTPEATNDIRIKSAETMRAAMLSNRPQNVIQPTDF